MSQSTGFDYLELTPQQIRLAKERCHGYAARLAIRVEAVADTELYEKLEALVDCHEALRTRFHLEPGAPHPSQYIEDSGSFRWHTETVDAERWEALSKSPFTLVPAPEFDLEQDPVLSASCYRTNEQTALLLLDLSALAADAVSLLNIFEGLAGDSSEKDEPVQYLDFADWLLDLNEEQEADSGRAWWRKHRHETPTLPQEETDLDEGGSMRLLLLSVPESALQRATSLAKSVNADVAQVFATAWAVLTMRLANQEAASIGVISSYRKVAEFKLGLGTYAQSLPIQYVLDPNESFAKAVSAFQLSFTDAMGYEEYVGHDDLPVDGYAFQMIHLPKKTAKYQLMDISLPGNRAKIRLDCIVAEASVNLAFQYDPTFHSESSTRQIGDMFVNLLQNMLRRPEAALKRLDLLSDRDHEKLLVFNRTEQTFDSETLVHGFIEAQVARHPERSAVIDGALNWTYGELNAKANRLAHYLRQNGVGPDAVVGIALERSADHVLSILAILKAGGAFVSINPTLPPELVDFLIRDSRARVILTWRTYQAQLPEGLTQLRFLDELDLSGFADENPSHCGTAQNLLNVIYTSGSTGVPKGVAVQHRSVANYVLWAAATYRVAEGAQVLLHSPMGFDLTVTSVFTPLMSGITLTVSEESSALEGMLSAIKKGSDYSMLKITPAHLGVLADNLAPEDLAGKIKTLVVGGEALFFERLASWRDHSPNTWIVNEYGPTEATVGCCIYRYTAGNPGEGPVPIGQPIANMGMHLMDAAFNVAPIGITGELCISGVGLARGYLGRPGLTAERFVPHPFGNGERLYKTGDLTRYVSSQEIYPEGTLIYVGRNDRQVKIRGYRIELGEVESVLNSLKEIRDAVVVTFMNAFEEKRIAAYVVTDPPDLEETQLRKLLEQRLPEYMHPSLFVRLDSMPLNNRGKVDRSALPAPEKARPMMDRDYAALRDEVEAELVEIWKEALALEHVGIHESFFSLGGDSIRSVRVTALAMERNLVFEVQDLFKYQTIAELADFLRQKGELNSSEIVNRETIKTPPFGLISEENRRKLPDDIVDAFPLGAIQLGMLFQMRLASEADELDRSAPPYHNVNGFLLKFLFIEKFMRIAVAEVVRRSEYLRTSFDLTGYSEPLQLVHKTATLKLEVTDLTQMAAPERDALISTWSREQNFLLVDITKPSLVRLHFFLLPEGVVQFFLVEPHSIADGWSTHLTMSAIFEYYTELMHGRKMPKYVPLRTSYKEFIRLEREALNSPETKKFWDDLTNGRRTSKLTYWPKPESERKLNEHKSYWHMPASMMASLRDISRRTECPIKSVFLAAHLKTISLLTGRMDLLTGLVVNGRLGVPDGDKVRGLFLNTLPLAFDIKDQTWDEMVAEIHHLESAIFPHRRYPINAIQKSWGKDPIIEIGFTYLQFHSVGKLFESGSIEDVAVEGGDLSRTQYPLMTLFYASPMDSNDVTLILELDLDLLGKQQIDAIRDTYIRVLTAMAANEPARPFQAHFLTAEEAQSLIMPPMEVTTTCVHQVFERHALQTPTSVAVSHPSGPITYAEINDQAERWASVLRSKGVVVEDRLAIFGEACPEAIIAMLAALKCGAAFVSISPQDSKERLARILAESGASLLLHAGGAVPDASGVTIIRMDQRPDATPSTNVRPAVSPENLVQILFPADEKVGVGLSHTNLCAMLACEDELFPSNSTRVSILAHPLSSELSAWEIWQAFYSGGRLVIPSVGAREQVDSFYQLLVDEQVTLLTLDTEVYALLSEYLADLQQPLSNALTAVMLVGSGPPAPPLPGSKATPQYAHLFGFAETTPNLAGRLIKAGDTTPNNLGRPSPAARVILGNPYLQPVQTYAEGEILAWGPGLARGYHKLPARTAERFIPNPFAEKPGERLFRTDVIGQRNLDGDILHVGRLTRISKLSLPGATEESAPVSKAYLAPRNLNERILARAWSDVMNLERISVHDNFFNLGGDSIIGIQILARIRQSGFDLSPNHFFQNPVLEDLAVLMKKVNDLKSEQGPITGNFSMTPILNWFFEKQLPNPNFFNFNTFLKVKAPLQTDALQLAFQALWAHHDMLRLRFASNEGGWTPHLDPVGEAPTLVVEDLTSFSDDEQTRLLETIGLQLQQSFDLTRTPLVKLVYFKLSKTRGDRLLLLAHHTVMDSVSQRLFLDDLRKTYALCLQGSQIDLPAKSSSFIEWADRLSKYVADGKMDHEFKHWNHPGYQHYQPLVPELQAGENTYASMDVVALKLGELESLSLQQKVHHAYNTRVDDLLLSSLMKTITDWSGGTNIVVDVESHGREDLFEDLDLSRTIGWFTSIHPELLGPATQDLGELVRGVKEQLRKPQFNGIGYGLLRYMSDRPELKDPLSVLPRAQIVFNNLGQMNQAGEVNAEFVTAEESPGLHFDAADIRDHMFEISGGFSEGCLILNWGYSKNLHHRSTIEQLVSQFEANLHQIMEHCIHVENAVFTPSDFPDLDLDQNELDELIDEYGLEDDM